MENIASSSRSNKWKWFPRLRRWLLGKLENKNENFWVEFEVNFCSTWYHLWEEKKKHCSLKLLQSLSCIQITFSLSKTCLAVLEWTFSVLFLKTKAIKIQHNALRWKVHQFCGNKMPCGLPLYKIEVSKSQVYLHRYLNTLYPAENFVLSRKTADVQPTK